MENAGVKARYLGAAQVFLEQVGRISEEAWSKPALGEWDLKAGTHTLLRRTAKPWR